ncbi:MAG: hypothetical protein HW416_2322 [Chloroflexi bacterium]|nr:hypothetical protein [Chloroflexota bacterium]
MMKLRDAELLWGNPDSSEEAKELIRLKKAAQLFDLVE